MKRLIALVLAFMFLLCGCKNTPTAIEPSVEINTESPPAESVPTATENTEPSEQTHPVMPVYTQQPMVAISVPVIYESTTAEDGTTVSTYAHQYINLVVQDQQIADTIIIDFLNRQDKHHEIAVSVSDQALSDYNGNSDWTAYSFESIYSPTRIDHSVLSLYGENVIYTGGRPQREGIAANYNMITGDVLTLGSILENVDALDVLCELVIDKMALIQDEVHLFDDYADAVRHRFSREESYDEEWYFSETGLNFFFAPYEVAPYIAGTVIVEIPYEDLSGLIADDFFPAEEDFAEGTIHAQLLSETKLQDFTQIAEVPVDTVGELIFLYCEGLVRNVRLELGVWNDSITQFTPTCTVFSTLSLTPGDGIMIQTVVPDSTPNLRLVYRTGEETITTYITLSSNDGSVILTDIF